MRARPHHGSPDHPAGAQPNQGAPAACVRASAAPILRAADAEERARLDALLNELFLRHAQHAYDAEATEWLRLCEPA